VIILGILASVVLAFVGESREDAARTAFASSGKVLVEAASRYRFDTGAYLEDSSSGALPSGFGAYVLASQWTSPTPIGGVWDAELNSFGITSGLGVHFNGTGTTRDDAYMAQIDAMLDDGDLGAGGFRKISGDRYYFVIAD
jgi:type II secretory pathway pseudopilin PulG